MSSIAEEDNQIERIGGQDLSGEKYLALGWEVQYLPSNGIHHEILKEYLERRFQKDGFGLSRLGTNTYQLWAPDELTQVRQTLGRAILMFDVLQITQARLTFL